MINQTAYALGSNRSCIRELFEYGRQRAAVVGAENVYDYSLGNPSIPAPAAVDETIREILQDTPSLQIHGYTSAVGDLQTRKAIAEDLNCRYQAGVKPENLFMGCGAAPELVAVFRALAVPGAEILAIAPYFPEYKPFCEANGVGFKVVPPDVPNFQINLPKLESVLTPATQAIIINSPNNPSGVVYTRETLTALAQLLTRKGEEYGHPIYIISDEPYREIAYDVEVPWVPGLYDRTLVCYSYSKSLSLPGERIGWVLVPPAFPEHDRMFAAVRGADREQNMNRFKERVNSLKQSGDRRLRTEREKLYNRVRQLEQQVATLENNIGFFSKSKGVESLIAEVEDKIAKTKREIADTIAKIKLIDGE